MMAKEGIELEDNVQIGGGVKIYSCDTIDNIKGKVTLKTGCCIGANAVILPNVIIGRNSIIGACSVVKHGTIIPDDEIWCGNPAKKIGHIFNGERFYEKNNR